MTVQVSIILPTYNRLGYLKEAVESVRAQTCASWELIVVDDGSDDDSIAWLDSLGDPRITCVAQAHTGHKSLLRNAGLACARADWIAFIDSDDRWTPTKLERQLAYHAANQSVRWSYTGRVFIDADGERLPDNRFRPWEAHSGWILKEIIALEANIALPSVMVARAVLRDVGGFNEAWRSTEDYELWLRLAERCECGIVDEPLLEVRKHRRASFQRPDVSLGFAKMFETFARRTPDRSLRATARTRAAYHAVDATNRLAILRRWAEARSALVVALRLRPLSPFTYRTAARLAWRRMRAAMGRSSPHGA
ncbi:MAG: glycosyltransferase [bacterium]